MRKKGKRRRKLWKPIVFGFAVLYLVTMGLATWLMGLKFREEFRDNMFLELSSFQQWVENYERLHSGQEAYSQEMKEGYYTYLVSECLPNDGNEAFQQFSGAVYGLDGELLARTEEVIGGSTSSAETDWQAVYRYHKLDVLTEEEKEILAGYVRENYDSDPGIPVPYSILAREAKDTGELCGILVEELTWKPEEESYASTYIDSYTLSSHTYDTGEKVFRQVGGKVVWEWEKPGVKEAAWVKNTIVPREASVQFPYLIYGGHDRWKKWSESEFLQGFADRIEISEENVSQTLWNCYEDLFQGSRSLKREESLTAPVQISVDTEVRCFVELRAQSYPWHASVDYLKYVYLCGFLLMLVCMGMIIRVTNKTYDRQAALEELRRDFTNAMAHELKTPLGIIRGFAENLKEHTMEEKRDYYLEQIIGQTEEMNQLVAQMITVSKMDSEHLVLQKENISMAELIKEQMCRFEPVLKEKELHTEYDCDTDFQVEGDRDYLAKAVWNLLSNAVSYNVPGGSIRVRTEKDRCSIENTGFSMGEEELARACDMFYRGDESRSERKEHMGLGLFLTKKILELHHLKLRLENTADGVRVTIET